MADKKEKKYHNLSLADKLKIIDRVENGEFHADVAKDFKVTRSAVSHLMKKKDSIREYANTIGKQEGNIKKRKMSNIENSPLEKAVYAWFRQHRNAGTPVSGPMIQEAALIYNELLKGPETFKASSGWLEKFKSRHGIHELAISGEKLSSNFAASQMFQTKLKEVIEKERYKLSNIYKADERGLYWKSLPQKTLVGGSESEAPGYKVSKERVSVLACSNATGDHKLPLLVIGKSKNPRCFIPGMELPVLYSSQSSSWMCLDIFYEWYVNYFVPSVKSKPGNEGKKNLLILDNASVHPKAEILNSVDDLCQVLYLPPNVTALIQPLDQGIIAKMKKDYRKNLLRYLLIHFNLDYLSFLKQWNLLHSITAIAAAWNGVPQTTIAKCCKNVLSELPLSEEIICNDDTIMNVIQTYNAQDQLSVESINEWCASDENLTGWRILNYEELLRGVSDTGDTLDVEDDTEQDGAATESDFPQISSAEAISGLETFIKWYSNKTDCNTAHLTNLYDIRESLSSN